MLPTSSCPDLEALFVGVAEGDETMLEHAAACSACAFLLEDHRQLEKDLFRIQDPLPPPDFTAMVMAKVAEAPVPVAAELKTGLAILFVAAGLFLTAVLAGGATAADVGAGFARLVVELRALAVAATNGVEAIWTTAAGPAVAVSVLLILSSLLWFRRLTSAPQSA